MSLTLCISKWESRILVFFHLYPQLFLSFFFFFFTAILIQRVVSVPDGCLGVAAIGQCVVNALPQCVPLPDSEACGSHYWEPSKVTGRSQALTAEHWPHLASQLFLRYSCSYIFHQWRCELHRGDSSIVVVVLFFNIFQPIYI